MFSIFCVAKATSRLLYKCQDHYSASCTLGLCLTLPKASLESTHARLLGPSLWRNQGQHNPSQPKIVGTTVSAFALPPPPPLPDVCVPPQGLATAPCAQQHRGDGAGGSSLGTSGRAIHKSRRRSTPTALCHLPKESKHFWDHQPTAEKSLKGMILVYFYFIKYTEQQEVHEEADAWKKQVSNADAIFASPLPACTSAHWVAVQKRRFLRYSYKFYFHGRKICPQRLEDQSTNAQKIPTLPLKTLMAQNN